MRRRHKQGPLSTDGMRSMWEFVFVSQFLRVFQRKFSFVPFTTEELENAFLEATNPALFGIFSRLLRTILPRQDIKATSWQEALKQELEKRNSEWNPFNGGKNYEHFSVENRILLLKYLIQFVADDKDKELKKFSDEFLDPDNSSVKPIGSDASNNVYWYFDDSRLYREAAGTKGSHSGWETVCVNCADWEKLLRTFQKSTNSNERKLYKYLKDELYPTVMPTVKENEKEKELETMIKKRSPKKQQKEVSRRKRDRNALIKKEEQGLERLKRDKKKDKDPEEEEEEDGGEETEEDEEDMEEFVEEVEAEEEEQESGDEEDEGEEGEETYLHPVAKETKEKSLPGEKEPRKRGRPAGSRARNTMQGSSERGGRKRKRSDIEKELMEKEMEERKELERRIDEEIEKQESMITASGVDSRAKRRCVIMREQLSQKKKEWWEEEGLGSDSENDEERDFDSDGSDRPRRRRKTKIPKPAEMPEPPNRIYVFSTGLANRASEGVQQGKFETITAYHRAQPASSPFLQVERADCMSYFGKQRPYYSKPYSLGGSANTMGQMTGYSGMSAGMHRADRQPSARPGYGASQWDQYQAQQLYKDRHRQAQTQAMDDIHQLLFGSPHGGNTQGAMGVNGTYSRSGYHNQQGGAVEPMSTYAGYPTQQHQTPYGDRRIQDARGQTQQSKFPAFSPQQQQQQQQPPPQGYFQRSRHLAGLQSQGNAHSPSSDPLGVGVRSPPPPYPGGRPPDSRHPRNSPNPVPSPTSTGSPHTPQTPLTPQTPHTPRFPGPSPTEPAKPPFSPSHPQGSMCGPTMPNYPAQAPPAVASSSEERPIGAQPRPGYIELSSKPMQRGMQNPFSSVMGSYNQVHSPLDGRRPEDNKSPGFGSPNNHESPLHSPTDHAPAQHYNSGPPNKSPFIRQGVQPILNHSPFPTSASAVPGSKSFSVESLTAPSQTFLDKGSLPPSQLSEQPMPQYSGLYFPSNKYSPMFGQPQYQYPSHIKHTGAFYNSQLTPNMYLGRASLPVYPPNRDSGL